MASIPPFLSIVTISFNQRDFLLQTIESVLSQKPADVEYIVVDPGSTDGSRELLARYADRIDHLLLEPDKGPADGLNKGFARARGEIGFFLNSDDFLLPGAIEAMRMLWRQHPAVGAILAGAWMVDKFGQPLRQLRPTGVSLSGLLNGRTTVVQQGFSFRMKAFRKIGGFNVENRSCWDYEVICRMALNKEKFFITQKKIGVFRIYNNSLTGSGVNSAHWIRYNLDIERIYRDIFGRDAWLDLKARRFVGRLQKMFLYPSVVCGDIIDRIFKDRMKVKFEFDMRPSD